MSGTNEGGNGSMQMTPESAHSIPIPTVLEGRKNEYAEEMRPFKTAVLAVMQELDTMVDQTKYSTLHQMAESNTAFAGWIMLIKILLNPEVAPYLSEVSHEKMQAVIEEAYKLVEKIPKDSTGFGGKNSIEDGLEWIHKLEEASTAPRAKGNPLS